MILDVISKNPDTFKNFFYVRKRENIEFNAIIRISIAVDAVMSVQDRPEQLFF